MLLKSLWSVLFVCVTATAAAAQGLVVIAANGAGPDYAPGKRFKSGAAITLPKGAKVTWLSKTGQVIKHAGPYSGALKAPSRAGGKSRSLTQVAKIVAGAKRSKVLGATRASSGRAAAKPADIWLGDVGRLQNYCAQRDNARLWRADAKSIAALAVTKSGHPGGGIVWPAGKKILDLPASAVADNIAIKMSSAGKTTSLAVHVLPGDIDVQDRGAVLQWMAAKNCQRQAADLIRQIHAR